MPAQRIIQLIVNILSLIALQPPASAVSSPDDDLEVLLEWYDVQYKRYFTIRISQAGRIVADHRISALVRPSMCTLPLGTVAAATFDYDTLRRLFGLMGNAVHRDLRTMFEWLTTSTLADRLRDHIRGDPSCLERAKPCDQTCLRGLSPRDLSTAGIARRHEGDVDFSAVAFRVPKSDGATSRFVWNGHEYDKLHQDVMGKPPKMPTLHPRDVVARILSGWRHISAVDFTSWFFQFGLPPALQTFFSFKMCRNTTMCMTVLPMGVCWAPTWAQHVALFITQVARRNLEEYNIVFDVVVWIDNLVVLSNSAADSERVQRAIDEVCRQLNVKTKPWECEGDGSSITRTLGFEVNLRDQWLRPAAKSRDKLDAAIDEFRTKRTPAQYFTLVGNLMWFAFVGAHSLCLFGRFMRFLREQSQRAIAAKEQHQWTTPDTTTFSDDIFNVVHEVYAAVRGTIVHGQQRRPPPSRIKWSTDASPQAAAGVNNYNNDDVFVLPLATTARGILPAELLAGFLASLLYDEDRRRHHPSVTWVTDNQAAYYAVLKAHSANELADIILCAWLLLSKLPDHVTWVPSNCQPADAFTRTENFPTSTDQYIRLLNSHRATCTRCATDSHETATVPLYDNLQTTGEQRPA